MTRPTGVLFMVFVADMDRATRFYEEAFEATVDFKSPDWTSLRIAGASIGLHPGAGTAPRSIGLGFEVADLEGACAAIVTAGGTIVKAPENKPDERITIAEVGDTEGNRFSVALAHAY